MPLTNYMEGDLHSWDAALLEPYSDKPDSKGLMLASSEDLSKLVHRYLEDGWQVVCHLPFYCRCIYDSCGQNIHCIGDRANRIILDVFEDLSEGKSGKPKVNISEWRPRIEHAQIISLTDFERFGRLGGNSFMPCVMTDINSLQ